MGVENIRSVPVVVSIGGTDYSLVYRMSSWEFLETKYGTYQEAIKKMRAGKSEALVDFIYAGLIPMNRGKITRDVVADSVDFQDINRIISAINLAIKMAVPEPGEGGAPVPPKA